VKLNKKLSNAEKDALYCHGAELIDPETLSNPPPKEKKKGYFAKAFGGIKSVFKKKDKKELTLQPKDKGATEAVMSPQSPKRANRRAAAED
jgi:hypothetical protein